MPWIEIHEEECPGCQRRGDEGQRKNGKCWRCNLPETLDPEDHGELIPKLVWERDNLCEAREDFAALVDHVFLDIYGVKKVCAMPIVKRLLERNARDLRDLGRPDLAV